MKNVAMVIVFMHCLCVGAGTARIGAYVIDAVTQEPIPKIKVSASFSNDNGWKAWTESAPIYHDTQETDVNGFCTLKGKTNIGRAGCGVDKQGTKYYGAGGEGFHFTNKNLFGVWQPDTLVATIRLQRVEHPIPLWVKNVKLKMKPEEAAGYDGTNAVWRYDLLVGDWLPPAGQGKIADLVVAGNYRFDGIVDGVSKFSCYEYSHSVEFPGKGNGVFENLVQPQIGIKVRRAPESGYERSAKGSFGRKKILYGVNIFPRLYSDEDANRCYVFRVRSRYDEKGNLVEAYYGKIYGDFSFKRLWDVGGQQPVFLYYLNPTSLDRNLEWDMKNNLCPNPGSLGQLQP